MGSMGLVVESVMRGLLMGERLCLASRCWILALTLWLGMPCSARVLADLIGGSPAIETQELNVGWLLPGMDLTELAGRRQIEAAVEAFQQGEPARSLDYLNQAVAANAQLPPAQVMLARMLLASGQLAAGRQTLEMAAAAHPESIEISLAFGGLAVSENRITDALLHFQRAKSLVDQSSAATAAWHRGVIWRGLAWVAERRGQWTEAAELWNQLLVVDPNDASARHRLGAALLLLGRVEEAEQSLRQAVQLDAALEPVELTMASLLHQQAEHDQADQWLERALAAHAEDVRILRFAANRALVRQLPEQALAHAQRWYKLQPDAVDALRLSALAARHLGARDLAIRLLGRLLQEDPLDGFAVNQLALTLLDSEDASTRARGLRHAEQLARLQPQSPTAATTLAWAQFRNTPEPTDQQLSQLLGQFEQALPGQTSDAEAVYQFSQILRQAGQPQRADRLVSDLLASGLPFPGRERLRGPGDQIPTPAAESDK